MAQISRLLAQSSALHLHAVTQTRDMNEAYLIVHGVMARALSRVGDAELDLGADLASALKRRALHLSAMAT